jgi:PAS domain S-box-containing protein
VVAKREECSREAGGAPTLEAALARLANLERERRVAEALLQIESLDLHGVVDRICRLTVELMPCDRATVYLHSSRARGFMPVADCGTPPQIVQRFAQQYFFGQSRAGGRRAVVPFRDALIAGRMGYATRDGAPTAEALELLDALEQYAICLVPLRSSTRGAIFVSVGEPPGFDDIAFRILDGVARQASNLIDHARTFRSTQHAARVRAGLAALAAAANLETDLGRIAALVCAEAARLFRLGVVAVLVPERDGLVVLADHGLDADGLHLPLGDETAILAQAFRHATMAFQNDVAESPMGRGPLARDLGLKSVLALPLVGREGPIGCLLLGHRERSDAFSPDIADETLVLGPIASAALERAALFQKVERSEEHFRSLIEKASDVITIVGPDWAFRYQSPSVQRVLGYGPEELIGRPVWELIHPDDRFALGLMFQAALDGTTGDGPRGVGEARFRHKDGSWRVLEGVGTPMRGPAGGPMLLVNSRDVSERKRAEARAASQKQVLELLARGGTLEEVLAALVESVEEDLGTAGAILVPDEAQATLRVIAAPRLPPALREALDGTGIAPHGNPCAAAANRRQRVVADDAGESAVAVGLRACWAEPILAAGGDLLGVLALYHPRPRPLTAEDRGIVEAAAHLAGIAVERKRAEHELARARDQAVTPPV